MKKAIRVLDFKVFFEADSTGGYVISCPSLSGCYSQGETVEEALENIKEAIELCIEDMKAHKEKIPDTTKTFVSSVLVNI